MRLFLTRSWIVLIALLCVVGAVSLVRSTAAQGTDFFVVWHAARVTLEGEPLYSIARDGGMVFKYPPWTVPFLLPLGFIPFEAGKWLWGIIQVVSLGIIVRWLYSRCRVSSYVWFPVLASFWGIWIVHALDGQVVLPMLAFALVCWTARPDFSGQASLRFFTLTLALTTKVFTVFPLFGLRWSRKTVAILALFGVIFALLCGPAVYNEPGRSPAALVKSWSEAASSGGKLLDPEVVRGRRNPGLPGWTLRILGVPLENAAADVIAALLYAILFAIAWKKLSVDLPPIPRWLGWLALTPVVHPLPWHHLFSFAFPLAVYAVDRAAGRRDVWAAISAFAGIALIGLSSENVLGSVGTFLEWNAAKSWGVLLLAGSVLWLGSRHELES